MHSSLCIFVVIKAALQVGSEDQLGGLLPDVIQQGTDLGGIVYSVGGRGSVSRRAPWLSIPLLRAWLIPNKA